MFVVIAYDTPSDERRAKFARMLKNYAAQRVQKSVFEAHLAEDELQGLIRRLEPFIAEKEDSVRVYRLCAACVKKIEVYGLGEVTPEWVSYVA
jgi:CRISPR-associated protein Cas2